MAEPLFWIYLINAILLINHEIDSAYWKEWELFKLPGDITGFLLLHFIALFVVLYGLVLVFQQRLSGYIISLIVGLLGLVAFGAHMYFIRKGREEFNTPISLTILVATLIVSVVQISLTASLLLV